MSDSKKKKPWVTPELRKIELTDELCELITSQARDQARPPVKRAR